LPIGINVESVSIRRSEIDASVELYRRLSSQLAAAGRRADEDFRAGRCTPLSP
jgi:hypothetical protein